MLISLLQVVIAQNISSEHLSRTIADIEARAAKREHVVACIQLASRQASDDSPWDEATAQRSLRFRLVENEHRFRFEILSNQVEKSDEPVQLTTWDGEQFMTKEGTDISIWSVPRMLPQPCTPLFCEAPGHGMLLTDLAKSVNAGLTVNQDVDNEVVTHRFRFEDQERQIMTVVIRNGIDPRIERFELAIFATDPKDGASPDTLWAYHVVDWTSVNGDSVPSLAYCDYTAARSPTDPTRLTTRTIYRRESVRDVEPTELDSTSFRIKVDPGNRVLDHRTKIGWTAGERALVVDGQAFLLAEAIDSDPFDRLPELIESAQRVPVPSESTLHPSGQSRTWVRASLLAFGVLPILVIVGAWVARRTSRPTVTEVP